MVRLFARAGVLGLRASRWHDVDETDVRVADLRAAGLLTTLDYDRQPAPAELDRFCCGQR